MPTCIKINVMCLFLFFIHSFCRNAQFTCTNCYETDKLKYKNRKKKLFIGFWNVNSIGFAPMPDEHPQTIYCTNEIRIRIRVSESESWKLSGLPILESRETEGGKSGKKITQIPQIHYSFRMKTNKSSWTSFDIRFFFSFEYFSVFFFSSFACVSPVSRVFIY